VTSKTIMFNVSEPFETAIDAFVGDANIARALMVREAVAAHIGYDLASEPPSTRRSKYASKEERLAAQKARAKRRRQITSQLMKAYEEGETEEAIRALIASLKAEDDDAAEDDLEEEEDETES